MSEHFWVRWSQWTEIGVVGRGIMTRCEMQSELQRFEVRARKLLEETGADHVVYGRKLFNEAGELEEVRFYLCPMNERICPVCRNKEHLPGAKFCMICGVPLSSCSGCVNEAASRDKDCCWYCSRNRRKNRQDLYRPMSEKVRGNETAHVLWRSKLKARSRRRPSPLAKKKKSSGSMPRLPT